MEIQVMKEFENMFSR